MLVDLTVGTRVGYSVWLLHAHTGVVQICVNTLLLLPSLAVAVRRIHDTDHSGWWLLVPVLPLAFWLMDSQHWPNRFGPVPGHIDPAVGGSLGQPRPPTG